MTGNAPGERAGSDMVKGWACPQCYRSKANYATGVTVPDECPNCGNDGLETWDSEPRINCWAEITPADKV